MTTYTQILQSVNMQDPEVYQKLILTGRSIVDNVEKELVTTETPLDFFSKEIELNGKQFVVKYASTKVQVAGVSLRDFYEKRLKRRIVV